MRQVQVAVVGAGPAGIAAALHAAHSGAEVLLLDEGDAPGGHLRWSIATPHGLAGGRGFEIAATSQDDLAAAGVEVMSGAIVWGLFDDRLLGVVAGGESMQVQASAVVLATGSTDIAYPFPGWELPGVMTARAALRLMHLYRVIPGQRAVVVGQGADANDVAEALQVVGIEVAAAVPSVDGFSASGDQSVERAEFDGTLYDVDTVVMALGRQPDPELALQALCEIGFSEADGVFVPLRVASLESSIPGVFVVGDAGGICTPLEAQCEGAVAGLAASGADIKSARKRLTEARSPERREQVERLRLHASSARP
jgi:sarcosine oxidase subunit alpha